MYALLFLFFVCLLGGMVVPCLAIHSKTVLDSVDGAVRMDFFPGKSSFVWGLTVAFT